MEVGFVGLGSMGAAMAANLLKAGHRVRVWNRSIAKAEALERDGARRAGSPAEAAAAGVVITMLADDAAVSGIVHGTDGILAGLGGGLHVSMSTIGTELSDRLAAEHQAAGSRYLAAPVFGRPAAAAAAKLFVVAAGREADIDAAQPLFDALGQRTFRVGTRPSAANIVKLCGNFMIMAAIETMAEAATLAAKAGVDEREMLGMLTGTLFDSPIYRTYSELILDERYRPAGFAAPLGLKDARLVGQAAEAVRAPMPVLGVIRDRLLATIAQEGEDVDWVAMALAARRSAGLK
jgi:3-hydroxyisobutyrate dehydrogenase-like beta-hydroxyacid dehydrogenase